MSNTEAIKQLIAIRDQLSGDAAKKVQLAIDALFAPIDQAIELAHLDALKKEFPDLF